MQIIFIKTAAVVAIFSLFSVFNGKGIKYGSIGKKEGCLKLFCDSYTDVNDIFEEEVISRLRMIKCDTVKPGISKRKVANC